MNDDQLLAALEPVKQHFFAKSVSVGTVLAAYLRRAGLHTTGTSWSIAMAAISSGLSFEQAIKLAEDTMRPPEKSDSGSSASGEEAEVNTQVPSINPTQEEAPFVFGESHNITPLIESAKNEVNGPIPVSSLVWYPKPTRAGDMDGEGMQKLLGAPSHNNTSLLIRETAQNSWDARREGSVPSVHYDLRPIEEVQRDLLKNTIFGGGSIPGTTIERSLTKPVLRVLEVSDRGTTGLDGPTRNDIEMDPTATNNFANFVLNVGVPRDKDKGAGTYGFGKIASFRASRCRAVVIWTRCLSNGKPEHRLIAIALGASFTYSGHRYTGHHWWGSLSHEDRIDPLTGPNAQVLGEKLFKVHFEDDFGTSILILDPDIEDEFGKINESEIVMNIQAQLWPKLHSELDETLPPMPISFSVDGRPLSVAFDEDNKTWTSYRRCLDAVRAVQAGLPNPHSRYGVVVEEIRSQRPKLLIGHLAIAKYVASDSVYVEGVDAVPPASICLMRNVAELVVKYERYPSISSPDVQWCGVFKPIITADDAFADAEPPAHDDWIYQSLDNRTHRRIVNISERERKAFVRRLLEPVELSVPSGASGSQAVGELADALGWIVPHGDEIQPKGNTGESSSGRRRTQKSVSAEIEVLSTESIQSSIEGFVGIKISIKLKSSKSSKYRILPLVSAVTENGVEQADEINVSCDGEATNILGLSMKDNESKTLIISFPNYLVVGLDFKITEEIISR